MRRAALVILSIGALLVTARAGQAQNTRLVLQYGSVVRIDGRSNVHRWSCAADSIEVMVATQPAVVTSGVPEPLRVMDAEVRIPVAALACGDNLMDRNLRTALRADSNPTIVYRAISFETTPADSGRLHIVASGTLSVAGVSRPVSIVVTATPFANGMFRATGTVPLRMTDFGVKPPTALFGILRGRNDVVVQFQIFVAPRGAGPQSAY
jgi:hypothetical protein